MALTHFENDLFLDLNTGSVEFISLTRDPEWIQNAELWFARRQSDRASVASRDADNQLSPLRSIQAPSWQDLIPWSSVELNNGTWRNFLAIDVDGTGPAPVQDALERIATLPCQPSWITISSTGAHAGWVIDSTRKTHYRSDSFALDIQHNLRRLAGGDASYSAHSTRCPVYSLADTTWLEMEPRTLKQLKAEVGTQWRYVPLFGKGSVLDAETTGRNSTLFTELAALARIDASPDALYARAHQINGTFDKPLTESEVANTVRSALRKRTGTDPAYKAILSIWGKAGGTRGTETQLQARQANLAQALQGTQAKTRQTATRVHQLADQGHKANDIAAELGINRATVYRHLKTKPVKKKLKLKKRTLPQTPEKVVPSSDSIPTSSKVTVIPTYDIDALKAQLARIQERFAA